MSQINFFVLKYLPFHVCHAEGSSRPGEQTHGRNPSQFSSSPANPSFHPTAPLCPQTSFFSMGHAQKPPFTAGQHSVAQAVVRARGLSILLFCLVFFFKVNALFPECAGTWTSSSFPLRRFAATRSRDARERKAPASTRPWGDGTHLYPTPGKLDSAYLFFKTKDIS